MAISVDVSSPARVTTAATSVTTASFDPPECVLVVVVNHDASAGVSPTVTISNNGTALTWTAIQIRLKSDSGAVDGYVGAWYSALTPARTGMTITATTTNANDITIKAYCLTGADMATTVGGSTEGSSSVGHAITTTGFTIVGTDSLGFVSGNDWNASGTASSSDTTFNNYNVASQMSGGTGYKTLASAGNSATFNLDCGTGTCQWNWVAFEILADTTTSLGAPIAQIVTVP